MPDYNPDKERHRDHKWIVHKAIQDRSFSGVVAADRQMKFNREGRFAIQDPGVAAEIRKEYPRDVTVTRVRNPHRSDRGHVYFFGQWPAMPWKDNGKGDEQ